LMLNPTYLAGGLLSAHVLCPLAGSVGYTLQLPAMM